MQSHNVYLADYMDYSVEKHRRNIPFPYEQLEFDLLCFYPDNIVLTLTSTLIDDSSEKFVEFNDFWKSGILKIHLEKGDNAHNYLNRKLTTSSNNEINNYEFDIYSSDGSYEFVNKYLKEELLNKGIDYVFPRTTDADKNNRQTFIDNLVLNERKIIENPYFPITIQDFDKIFLKIQKLADDSNFIFQRSYIIKEIMKTEILKNNSLVPKTLLSVFDESYNQAMAKSVNGTIISTLNKKLNGVGLKNFISGYSPKLYNLIRMMSPNQIFLLAQDRNWQIYRNFIMLLFAYLSEKICISQNSKFYQKTIIVEMKYKIIDFCIDKMTDAVFEALKNENPLIYFNIQQAKNSLYNYLIHIKEKHYEEYEYYSEEIIKRTKLIEQICQDILNGLYTL